MKTAREILENEFGAFGSDELSLALKNNLSVSKIIRAMENYAKQKLLQHGIMQGMQSDCCQAKVITTEIHTCENCACSCSPTVADGAAGQNVSVDKWDLDEKRPDE